MMRSQMAEAFYNSMTESDDASSAGTAAVGIDAVSRRALKVMKEIGMTMDGQHSKQLTPKMIEEVDRIILFHASKTPSELLEDNRVEKWNISDLGYGVENCLPLDRQVRDDIKARVETLIKETS